MGFGQSGPDSTLKISSGATPTGETPEQRRARLTQFSQMFGLHKDDPRGVAPAPDLADAFMRDAASGQVQRLRMGQGRKASFLGGAFDATAPATKAPSMLGGQFHGGGY